MSRNKSRVVHEVIRCELNKIGPQPPDQEQPPPPSEQAVVVLQSHIAQDNIALLLNLDDYLAKRCNNYDLLRVDSVDLRLVDRISYYHFWAHANFRDGLRGLARLHQAIDAGFFNVERLLRASVFKLNDFEWWAGYDLESVKAKYLEVTGVPEGDAFDEPYELDADALTKLIFRQDPYDTHPETRTFREELELMIRSGQEFPCPFACTES